MYRFLFHRHACFLSVGGLFVGLMACSTETASDASSQANGAPSAGSAESSGPNSSEESPNANPGSSDETALEEMEKKLQQAACTESGVPSEMWVEREQLVLMLQDESKQQEWRKRLDTAQFETQCPEPTGATP